MSRLVPLLWLLLGASFVLAPFSTLHAHLGGHHDDRHDHGILHGGHVHDGSHATDDADHHDAGQAVDVNFAMSDRGAAGFSWTYWLPLVCSLAVTWLMVRHSTLILRPPDPSVGPRLRFTYWRPPLRGPPLLSI